VALPHYLVDRLSRPRSMLEAGILRTRVLQLLGRLEEGRARAPSGSDGVGALSTREREIAILVAQGGTNGEIADTLAISARTVERHLTNILAKLGARNRTELASIVRQPG
jgi:DNA-binding NarL/FixJ family response regulator